MKQLKIDKFLDYLYPANLQTSPKAKHLSFTLAKADLKENTYLHDLYISDGQDHQKLLHLKEEAFYVWENEDNILYFNHQSENDKKLKDLKYTLTYRFNINSQKSDLVYQFKIPVSKITILNKDQLLLESSLSQEDHQLLAGDLKRQKYLNSLKDQDHHIIEEIPFYRNGESFIDKKRSQAFIYNIKDDTYTALVDKNTNFQDFELSADKKLIYFTSSQAKDIPSLYNDLSVYNLLDKTTKKLYSKEKVSINQIILLKDQVYLLGDDKSKYQINQNPDFFKLVDDDLEKVLTFAKSFHNTIGSDVKYGLYESVKTIDDNFYFIGTRQDRSILYSFDGQKLKEVFTYKGSLETFVAYQNTYYGLGLFDQRLMELYRLDFKENTLEKKSHFNDKNIKNTYIAKANYHQFKNDGYQFDGWVLLPKDYDKNKEYPGILTIHGGPKTIYADVFFHEMQVWVNLGYIVFYTNPRGSDSFGDDFADIRGRYGSIDYDDLMAFTDFVLDNYSVDKNRLGVTGGSYGGFMTNWIVSHTNRFKVAATQRSISNWISFYGTSDIGVYFQPDQTAGHPLDDHKLVWQQSPLKHADKIQTPLLFIHADQDYRCPIEQAMQLYSVVKMNGVDSRFVWFKGENHELSRSGKPKARLTRLQEITNWLNKYLTV